MNEMWSISGSGYSVKTESGQIVFEYTRKVESPMYDNWLSYAEHVCFLHNQNINMNGEDAWYPGGTGE